jgi:DNA replication licensing factor MCM3
MASAYLDDPTPPDEALDSRARPYQEFLENDAYNYHDEIVRMLNLDQTRLIVNLDDLRAYRRELATAFVLHHLLPPSLTSIGIVQPSQGAY